MQHTEAMDYPLLTSSAYAQIFIRANQLEPARVLAGTGLTEQDLAERAFIDYKVMSRIIRNVDAAGVPGGWAARVGQQLHVSTHGHLGFAALSAPTLGSALAVMAEYHPVRITTLTARLETVGRQLVFSMADRTDDPLYARYTIESTLRVLEALVETVVGHGVGDYVEISFPWPAPDYVEVLEQLYGVPCQFNAPRAAIALPASWAHIPSALYDEGSYRANVARCREIMAGLAPASDTRAQVQNILAAHFDQVRAGQGIDRAPPSLAAIATRLHTTPRTLIRRLKRQQCSYRQLLEQARVECADSLLNQAALSVADVADRLGYSDPANFGRAFRRVTGVTPAAWRRGRR